MITLTESFEIRFGKFTYHFAKWERYRKFVQYNVFPDYCRMSNDKYGFESSIGLYLKRKEVIKYQTSPKECIWNVYQDDVHDNFQIIIDWYKSIYGTTKVQYNEIELAQSRIDMLLFKYKKLISFM